MSAPIIPGGCILLSRKIIESEIWKKPPLYLKVWIYLLSKAQHSPYKKLKRGQLVVSIPDIIEDCCWQVGYRKEKPTKDQIFQIIEWLRKVSETPCESNTHATMITTTKATHGLLINIVNYDLYQTLKNYESNNDGNNENSTEATREQRHPNNINNNDNNVLVVEGEEVATASVDNVDNSIKQITKSYSENIGLLTPAILFKIEEDYLKAGIEAGAIVYAIEQAATQGKMFYSYIEGILNVYKDNNIKTRAEAEESKRQYEEVKKAKKNQKPCGNGGNTNKPTFNNFKNRKYDSEALEKWLLIKDRTDISPEEKEKVYNDLIKKSKSLI